MNPVHAGPKSIRREGSGVFRSHYQILVSALIMGTASAAFGGTVQITQVGNELTVDANLLNADLTGDNIDDLTGLAGETESLAPESGIAGVYETTVRAFLKDGAAPEIPIASARSFSLIQLRNENLEVVSQEFFTTLGENEESSSAGLSRSGFFPVTFSDASINAGLPTNGLLEVQVSSEALTVQFIRLVFDDASVLAPADAIVGEMVPEFDPDIYVQRAAQAAAAARSAKVEALSNTISAQKRKLKSTTRKLLSAEKRNQVSSVGSLSRLIRNLKKQIRSLQIELNLL